MYLFRNLVFQVNQPPKTKTMSDEKKEEEKKEKKEKTQPSTIRRKRKKGAAHAVKIPQGKCSRLVLVARARIGGV